MPDTLDATDRRLVVLLQVNALARAANLARQYGSAHTTIIARIGTQPRLMS
jgi:DNA-binding Lrp family transcriptional regulator